MTLGERCITILIGGLIGVAICVWVTTQEADGATKAKRRHRLVRVFPASHKFPTVKRCLDAKGKWIRGCG